jgi:hypothetical protein
MRCRLTLHRRHPAPKSANPARGPVGCTDPKPLFLESTVEEPHPVRVQAAVADCPTAAVCCEASSAALTSRRHHQTAPGPGPLCCCQTPVRSACVMTCASHARSLRPSSSLKRPWSCSASSTRQTTHCRRPNRATGQASTPTGCPSLMLPPRFPCVWSAMGDEGASPLIRPWPPPVISRWRRSACNGQLARCTPSLMS